MVLHGHKGHGLGIGRRLGFEQLTDRGEQDAFDRGGDAGRPRTGFVTAWRIGDLGADVAGRIVPLDGHRHEPVWPHLLRGQLGFDEQLTRQVQHHFQTKANHGFLLPNVGPLRA